MNTQTSTHAFDKAKKTIVFGDHDLAARALNLNDPAGKIVMKRLKEITKESGSQKITEFHMRQAMEDFSATTETMQASGNVEEAKLSSQAFNKVVSGIQTFMRTMGRDERDVFKGRQPQATILNSSLTHP